MILTTIIYISFGVLPSLIWLFFYLREDAHPEPKKLIIQVFILGMLAAPAAVGGEYLMIYIYDFFNIRTLLTVLIGIAVVEEIIKYLVVRWRILRDKEFDEPVDAMIYMVISALGFAAIENILFAAGPFQQSLSAGFGVIIGRFLGATLLHSLASGIIGYFIAISILHKAKNHYGHLLQGLLIAITFHTLYNWLIIKTAEPIYIGLLLLTMAIFVGLAFRNLRFRVFKPVLNNLQFKTWRKNPS